MRVIRSHAAEWGLDTNRIGAMGFSAGGEVLALLVYNPTAGDPKAADPIDRMNCRTDFQISVYPGSLGVPTNAISNDAPPAFFIVANDDESHVRPVLAQVEKYSGGKAAGGISPAGRRRPRIQPGNPLQICVGQRLAATHGRLADGWRLSESIAIRIKQMKERGACLCHEWPLFRPLKAGGFLAARGTLPPSANPFTPLAAG